MFWKLKSSTPLKMLICYYVKSEQSQNVVCQLKRKFERKNGNSLLFCHKEQVLARGNTRILEYFNCWIIVNNWVFYSWQINLSLRLRKTIMKWNKMISSVFFLDNLKFRLYLCNISSKLHHLLLTLWDLWEGKEECQSFLRCVILCGDISTTYLVVSMLKSLLTAHYGSHKTVGARENCCNRLFFYIKRVTGSFIFLCHI